MKESAVAIAGVIGLALAGAALSLVAGSPSTAVTETDVRPRWVEVNWPFAIDQWGSGRAYTCRAADCGTNVDLYLRRKLGFCNCRGVEDDDSLTQGAEHCWRSKRACGSSDSLTQLSHRRPAKVDAATIVTREGKRNLLERIAIQYGMVADQLELMDKLTRSICRFK